jgi:D-alanyl-lipoteichoic acid acyltransferase DltB (MBOAT superfamily)
MRTALTSVYAVVVGGFLYTLYRLSEPFAPHCAADPFCHRFLEPSFLLGDASLVDVGDHQWHSFRKSLKILVPLSCAHVVLGRLLRRAFLGRRVCMAYDAITGVALVLHIHRAQTVHLLLFALVNFQIGRLGGTLRLCGARAFSSVALSSLLSWALFFALLLLRTYGRRLFRFANLFGPAAAWLDQGDFAGMGWWDHANLLALRMLSFNLDRQRSRDRGSRCSGRSGAVVSDQETSAGETAAATTLDVQERCVLPPSRYGWLEYLGYTFYAPLYIAGPVICANAFLAQQQELISDGPPCYRRGRLRQGGEGGDGGEETPTNIHTPEKTAMGAAATAAYACRWAAALVVMEALSSRAPCFALARSRLIGSFGAAESLSISYLTLKLVWLKFLLIWRFFRFWAMLDGRFPSENLPRCMSNHYSALQFWRSWHASFNRWLVRYVYLPLGGRKHRSRNVLLVFVLVALWHGVEANMFMWAALMALFMAPELVAEAVLSKHPELRKRWYHRHLVAAGGASTICLLILANQLGFGFGTEGVAEILSGLTGIGSADGLRAAAIAWGFLFCGVELMVDLEREKHADASAERAGLGAASGATTRGRAAESHRQRGKQH